MTGRLAGAAVLAVMLSLVPVPVFAHTPGHMGVDPDRLQGANQDGLLMLYAPDPVESGSSISHWDRSAFPNLLMEPSINPDLPYLGLDITPALMADIGWAPGTSNIVIWDLSGPGAGFADPTPFAGAPGNPATTLGDARFNLFNAVLGTWATTLSSTVDIDVVVVWTPLQCFAGIGAVLGSAGALFVFQGGSADPLPLPGYWYPAALAEALYGEDLTGSPAGGGGDIVVFMNSAIDEECLGPGTSFYYGLDGNAPSNQIMVSTVLLHEIAHGLGHANFTNEQTGVQIGGDPSVYDFFTYDSEAGKHWDEMTSEERVVSATNFRRVVWDGTETTVAAAGTLAAGVPYVEVVSPEPVGGRYDVGLASFGAPLTEEGVSGLLVCVRDEFEIPPWVTTSDGCEPIVNAAEVAGNIAVIDRGWCAFTTKVANAQAAGAVGAVIVNLDSNMPINLGGFDPSITIPAVSVGRDDGLAIRAAVCSGGASVFEVIPVLSSWGLVILGFVLMFAGLLSIRR